MEICINAGDVLCDTDDHWEFVGHTMVTNNYVRLTADVRSSQGAIWNTAVCSALISVSVSLMNTRNIYTVSTKKVTP